MKLFNNPLVYLTFSVVFAACGNPNTAQKETPKEEEKTASYAVQMADAEIKRTPDPRYLDFREKPKWEYTNGLVCLAMMRVWETTGDEKYLDYATFYADSMILDDGNIVTYSKTAYNIDRVNPGKFLIDLYKNTEKSKYKRAVDTLRQQMREHPRTSEGGFWHKKRYPHQMWLDGIYMGSPFLAQYAAEFNEPALFDDVANQILLADKYMYSKEKHLYYHGWDESREQDWADNETGLSPNFWGRAMGWYAMALVDALDFFPKDHPKRDSILVVVDRVASGLAQYQDEKSGVWYQVLDQGSREGNYLEASASSMFTYFYLKALRKGYIDEDKYSTVAEKAWNGVLESFIEENEDGTISITNVCGVAGLGGDPYRSGTYEYYVNEVKRDNDPKAVGPFIMAALEHEKQ